MKTHKHQSKKEASQLKAASPNSTKSGAYLEDQRVKNATQRKAKNNTGLPDQLKSGVEQLSGHSMDDVIEKKAIQLKSDGIIQRLLEKTSQYGNKLDGTINDAEKEVNGLIKSIGTAKTEGQYNERVAEVNRRLSRLETLNNNRASEDLGNKKTSGSVAEHSARTKQERNLINRLEQRLQQKIANTPRPAPKPKSKPKKDSQGFTLVEGKKKTEGKKK